MKEFDYSIDYKNTLFTPNDPRYRIGRGEQGVLLIRPYTEVICEMWKFRTPDIARQSANSIYQLYTEYRSEKDFVGMDMCRKFLEMGFTRARRYANHHSGTKYDDNGEVRPQESDHWTCDYNRSAQIFKRVRDIVANNEEYKKQRKLWRSNESTHAVRVDALAATSNVTRQRYSRKRTKVSG